MKGSYIIGLILGDFEDTLDGHIERLAKAMTTFTARTKATARPGGCGYLVRNPAELG